jgi:hypothetical protein
MLNAEYFQIAHRFVRKPGITSEPPAEHNAARYDAMRGVLIEPHSQGGVCVVGCCGRVMCALWDPTGFVPLPIVVRTSALVLQSDLHGKTLIFKGPSLHVKGIGIPDEPIEYLNAEAYGNWRKALNVVDGKSSTKETTFFNRDLKKFNFGGPTSQVSLWAGKKAGKTEPFWVTNDEYPDFVGAVMPVSTTKEHMFRRPQWIDES